MKTISQNYIDYWQCAHSTQKGLKNRFGVRVRDGRCWALVQLGTKDPFTFGNPQNIPVELSLLPSYLQLIVTDELLNDPGSDFVEVLTGRKSFQEALALPAKIEPKRMTATGTVRLPHAS